MHLSGDPVVYSQKGHGDHFEDDNGGVCGEGKEHIAVYQVGHLPIVPAKNMQVQKDKSTEM